MSLQDFLNAHPIDNLTEEVVVSPRFKDNEGKLLSFTIKAMTGQQFEDIRKGSMEIRKGRKVEFDAQKFSLRSVISNTINPNFKDAKSIKQMGCNTPEEYVQKVLLAGEITVLAGKIQELSGFDVGMDTLVEEAKN